MPHQRMTYRMPDLGLGETPIQVSVWHVKAGQPIEFRQRFVEVTAGAVMVDLPAPATGVVAEFCVLEDELISPGQALAVIDRGEDHR